MTYRVVGLQLSSVVAPQWSAMLCFRHLGGARHDVSTPQQSILALCLLTESSTALNACLTIETLNGFPPRCLPGQGIRASIRWVEQVTEVEMR